MKPSAITLASAILLFSSISDGLCQGSDTKQIVEFFVGNCLQVPPDTKHVQAASRVMKWQPLQGDLALMLAPSDPEATWEGWAAKYEGKTYLVGISEAQMDGRTVVGCTVAVREVDQEELVKLLTNVVKMRALNDETEAMQRYLAWVAEVNRYSMLVNLTTQAGSRLSTASLSALVKLKERH